MNVKIEKIEKNTVKLEIEIDSAIFEEGLQKAFLKNAKKFNIPGFRKGKATRQLVERHYGAEVLFEDAINIVCPEAYDKAVEENGIIPVERPEIDVKQIGKDKNLIFTATVTVKPEVLLGEYKGVEVTKVDSIVTSEDVDKELEKVAEKNARVITIEDRAVESGDITVIDFEGFIDGVAFEGGKGVDYELTIGSNQFIAGFEDQLIGTKTGEETEVNVTFPEDYQKEELSGKPAMFKVTVKQIKSKQLPEIDDELVMDISEFNTLQEYKEDLMKKLTEEADKKAKQKLEESIINKVLETVTVDIPKVMVDKHIDRLIYDFDMSLRYQGFDMDRYLAMMGIELAAFREQLRERAEKEVKVQLILEKITEVESIVATEEDVTKEIERIAAMYNKNADDFRKEISEEELEYLKANIAVKNTVEMLVQNAKIV